ncbi:cytochrome P450 [Pyrenophora seminiperda CCB06]|uniref:Cytochrome P450 n=1 Tax=Pyrenophora seminiperda CCB06 TaxID=1302712 RepID=A0A3M7LY94_9PLEO|nr:cytochrome P450 [Pyrenophora seminiperda CCB06]
MHHLRDSLLSTVPKGPSDITKPDNAVNDRQDVRDCIARGEFESVRDGAFYNRTWIISERYCNGDGVDSLEGYLHSIWHMYYQLSRHTSHETSTHDGLVLDIVRIQGLGPLTRPVSGNFGIDIARTVEGTLWNDLPFLVTDMTEFWTNECATMSTAHRLNFSSFLAKLASTRVGKDKVCQIALLLFHATFEETRELCSSEKSEDEDRRRTMRDLSIADLLPSACAWIKEAEHNLMQLSDVYWNDCPSTIGQGGPNFVESELGKRSPTGFTPWRWMYWLKRLHEIKSEAQESHEERLVEYATDAIGWMINGVNERNSGILRAYQGGGADLHQDKHLACLNFEGPALEVETD